MLIAWLDSNGKLLMTDNPEYVPTIYQASSVTFSDLSTSDAYQVIVVNGSITTMSQEQILQYNQQQYLNRLSDQVTNYISSNYPQIKINSDLADKEYYTTAITYSTTMSEVDIRNYTAKVVETAYSQTISVSNIIMSDTSIPSNLQIPFIQLAKVGLRLQWVNNVKQSYYNYQQQILSTTSLSELQSITAYTFPPYPSNLL